MPRGRPTVIVETEALIRSYDDLPPWEFAPDSVYLAFNRIPSASPLTGRIYISLKINPYWENDENRLWNEVYEGVFMVNLPERNNETPIGL